MTTMHDGYNRGNYARRKQKSSIELDMLAKVILTQTINTANVSILHASACFPQFLLT